MCCALGFLEGSHVLERQRTATLISNRRERSKPCCLANTGLGLSRSDTAKHADWIRSAMTFSWRSNTCRDMKSPDEHPQCFGRQAAIETTARGKNSITETVCPATEGLASEPPVDKQALFRRLEQCPGIAGCRQKKRNNILSLDKNQEADVFRPGIPHLKRVGEGRDDRKQCPPRQYAKKG